MAALPPSPPPAAPTAPAPAPTPASLQAQLPATNPNLQAEAQNLLGQRTPAPAPALAPGEIPHPAAEMAPPILQPGTVGGAQQAHQDVSPFGSDGSYTPSAEAVAMMQKWLIGRSHYDL